MNANHKRRNQELNKKGRFWSIVFPEKDQEELYHTFEELVDDENTGIGYITGQLEEGEESGYRHFQMYFAFKDKKLGKTVINFFKANKINIGEIERRKGSHEQMVKYCTKGDTRIKGPWEWGSDMDIKQKKKPTQLILERIREGTTIKALLDDDETFWVTLRNKRNLESALELYSEPRDFKTEVYIYWGISGAGKSWKAREEAGKGAYHMSSETGGFWEGYDGERNVIWNEFDGSKLSWSSWKQLCDDQGHRVNVKGSSVNFRAKKIFFTSNDDPELWWANVWARDPDCYEQFKKRVTKVVHFDKKYNK